MTDRYESRATTHADDCWSWGPAHYECAARQVEQLAEALREARQMIRDLRMGLRYAVRVWVLSDEIAWSEAKIDEVVERIIGDAKEDAGND